MHGTDELAGTGRNLRDGRHQPGAESGADHPQHCAGWAGARRRHRAWPRPRCWYLCAGHRAWPLHHDHPDSDPV
ncbi:hypothetical protein AERO8C_30238 [Aeromonas veronii]|uniref:Uncharacterized protein n=1 Tax=Aeromonas veronii TaxID=654 RepID=A0A653L5Z5_AERVE|nr:hypothetical protein AERO8C_30238 [Aeromonas veronii]